LKILSTRQDPSDDPAVSRARTKEVRANHEIGAKVMSEKARAVPVVAMVAIMLTITIVARREAALARNQKIEKAAENPILRTKGTTLDEKALQLVLKREKKTAAEDTEAVAKLAPKEKKRIAVMRALKKKCGPLTLRMQQS
jgi:hypothetical protein